MNVQLTKPLKPCKICKTQPMGDIMKIERCASPVQIEATSRANLRAVLPHDAGDPNFTPKTFIRKEGATMNNGEIFENAPNLAKELGIALDAPPRRSLEIDTAKYQKYLDDPALDDAQKEEIIHALWSIMMNFVDLGFGIHPVQEACGELGCTLDHQGDQDSNGANPDPKNLSAEFNAASRDT